MLKKRVKKTYRVSVDFVEKLEKLNRLEEEQEYPLSQSQLLDEMIDEYYARHVYKKSELDFLPITKGAVNDSLRLFTKEIATFHNALLDALYERLEEFDGNGNKDKQA